MSNRGIPESQGKSVPNESESLIQSERSMWTSLISLPPLPPVVLPNPDNRRFERFKITESLLEMEHQDGKSVCAHILGMKSHIDTLIMLGVSISNKLVVDWVLQSLPESYDKFIREYHMMKLDATLIDLTYMLIAAESEMIWRSNGAYLSANSTNHASMDTTCSCCQGKGQWIRSCPKDLKNLRDRRVDEYGSTSGLEKREEV
ncbi:uncharacterized protein LOC111898715 [Lactuca sativa]|uniref:uncharacterized protein LOC111898715 n=1 Tax=Lactuca sativa TaxID=4236 RepID=UPI0022B0169B|nr:uncharacterized protein LOC111898715 [Lactuca sativa]XP_052621194.1 uncharacterized protein LOC111898715 [Lactuca sativa]XP_052621195.1 uncharacterized protein LOC111898715 [Lactuca sativa]XP_052621196.1 uncharacterized protein LOC111898715 [Lactuca sativa]XP_052621197.1 uncharacterized protein LOC111898715 [Lactuca sativa]XP_052621198.1 uncharacterized protein LOC111898715 [Lactuca sativa]XP_052621199.1 uncharacterized protein LOC111898715 [Lactuca sativa]XP_052621200.1 uncharacterized p